MLIEHGLSVTTLRLDTNEALVEAVSFYTRGLEQGLAIQRRSLRPPLLREEDLTGKRPATMLRGAKALVVLAHPDPASFNHAPARRVADCWSQFGIGMTWRDLHAERFDPVLTSDVRSSNPSQQAPRSSLGRIAKAQRESRDRRA